MGGEKEIGSLFITGLQGPRLEPGSQVARDLAHGGLGGIILFDHCLHSPEVPGNIESPEQVRQLTAALQDCAGGELLICVDQEGGAVERLNRNYGFPHCPSPAEMAAAAPDAAVTGERASATAAMLHEAGIDINFAPVVDLNLNPANPVIGYLGRSFSSDPATVTAHAAAWIEAHRNHGVLSCLKHFPGHGSSSGDSHEGFVDITHSWLEEELLPYRTLLATNHVDLVMTGHLLNRSIDPLAPATLSEAAVNGLLRDHLGYDGAVVSDDMQMKAITDHYHLDEAVCRAFAAGVDIIVFGNNLAYDPLVFTRAVRAVQDGLKRGLLTERQLHRAIMRVKAVKDKRRT